MNCKKCNVEIPSEKKNKSFCSVDCLHRYQRAQRKLGHVDFGNRSLNDPIRKGYGYNEKSIIGDED